MSTGSYNFERLEDASFQTERLYQQSRAIRGMEAGLLRTAGLAADHDVLEVGSGPGFVTDLLAELAPAGSVHAVEPSPALCAQIEANVHGKPARGLFVLQALGDALPLDDGCIDFSYARFVLQHVPRPADVIGEIHRVTRPGGRFCAVDSDDGLVILHPEDGRVAQVLHDAQAIQAGQGGDRFVGRKLQEKMIAAGFTNVRSRVLMLTSSELPFQVLFNILLGYKASLLGGSVDVRALYEDLAQRVASGRLMLAAGVFIVSGEKV
mgnify:CR=1 FL=1